MRPRLPRRPWWAIGALTVGGLWLLFVGSLYVTGYSATVTVTGGDGNGFCDVAWEDPSGRPVSGEADCYDESPGSRFGVRVSGWPDAGEPTRTESYVGIGLVLGLPPLALGAGRLGQLAWRRRQPMPDLATATVAECGAGALTHPGTAAALRRTRRRAWSLAGLGAIGACTVVVLAAIEISGDEYLRAAGVTTVGTVLHLEPDGWRSSDGASVRFTVDGVTRARDVTLGGYADGYVEGQVVDVVYDPSDPDRFIIDDALYGPDWTGWVLAPSLLAACLAGPFGLSRLSRAADMRELLGSRAWAQVRVRVLFQDERWEFATAEGVVWRSHRHVVSPLADLDPRMLFGRGLPDDDPAAPATDQPVWWVCDGTTAVFSADQGRPLILARRR